MKNEQKTTIAELLSPPRIVRIVTSQSTSGDSELLEVNEQGLLVRQWREGAISHVQRFYPWTHILYIEELTEERAKEFSKGVAAEDQRTGTDNTASANQPAASASTS